MLPSRSARNGCCQGHGWTHGPGKIRSISGCDGRECTTQSWLVRKLPLLLFSVLRIACVTSMRSCSRRLARLKMTQKDPRIILDRLSYSISCFEHGLAESRIFCTLVFSIAGWFLKVRSHTGRKRALPFTLGGSGSPWNIAWCFGCYNSDAHLSALLHRHNPLLEPLYFFPSMQRTPRRISVHVFADLASPAPAGACCAGAIIGAHFPVDLFLDRLCYFDLWRRDGGMQKPASWRFNRCWALLWSASISAKDYDGLVARLAHNLHACYLVFHLASTI